MSDVGILRQQTLLRQCQVHRFDCLARFAHPRFATSEALWATLPHHFDHFGADCRRPVSPYHLIALKRQEALLVGPVPVGECTSLRTDDKHLVDTVHRIGPKEAEHTRKYRLVLLWRTGISPIDCELGNVRSCNDHHEAPSTIEHHQALRIGAEWLRRIVTTMCRLRDQRPGPDETGDSSTLCFAGLFCRSSLAPNLEYKQPAHTECRQGNRFHMFHAESHFLDLKKTGRHCSLSCLIVETRWDEMVT